MFMTFPKYGPATEYLMKVYRQQEIQDNGLKKGNALSLTVILEVGLTYTKYRLEIHIT